jgi:flagellar biosynthesis/type III secretory pathway M-ring protein FliF/YscJ
VYPQNTLLYGKLELEDHAAIIGCLEALGVALRLQDDGHAILVPTGQALRPRMTLAEEGLPRGGTVGHEIFDQQSALRPGRVHAQTKAEIDFALVTITEQTFDSEARAVTARRTKQG